MSQNDFMQLSFDFDHNNRLEEKPVAPLPFAKKVIDLAPYLESKKQERTAQLYQDIFDSIKHIG